MQEGCRKLETQTEQILPLQLYKAGKEEKDIALQQQQNRSVNISFATNSSTQFSEFAVIISRELGLSANNVFQILGTFITSNATALSSDCNG